MGDLLIGRLNKKKKTDFTSVKVSFEEEVIEDV